MGILLDDLVAALELASAPFLATTRRAFSSTCFKSEYITSRPFVVTLVACCSHQEIVVSSTLMLLDLMWLIRALGRKTLASKGHGRSFLRRTPSSTTDHHHLHPERFGHYWSRLAVSSTKHDHVRPVRTLEWHKRHLLMTR
jgi:hypothetical protein